jgi:hypothetical protein
MATKPHSATETIHHTGRSNSVTGAAFVSPHTTEELTQMAAGSVGAQIILDYNGSGSLGARGGAGATIEENTMARDAHMVALGLDPVNPSGPPAAPDPAGAVRAAGAPVGRATRISSLAAGIITGDPGTVPPPGGSNGTGGTTAPVNRDVPHVSQAGDTLNCTMGNWEGEPTSYGYQWKIDGAVVGTDAATHTVTAADVGKVATCVVTATNAHGSTAAPPSNEVTIADPATGGQSRSKR